jgi:hypothetical protein
MEELFERFRNFCNMSNIDLDGQFEALKEHSRVDVMDIQDKYQIKINILKNSFKLFLEAEGQTISEKHLEFVIKFSNLV